MAITTDDFNKIWASTSPLTPYEFSDSQYKQGWNFVGATPPSRQMWDAFMKNADEKLKYLYNHEDVPVGFEYFTMNPNIPQGSLPLLGGEYSRETYSALWSWVQEQTGYLKTEAEWQTLSTANNGNVPFYSSGDGSTTFRVPSLKCWVKGANGTVGMWLVKAYGVIVDTGTIDEQAYIDDRFNASKQYTDDEIADVNSDISAINSRLGNVISANGTSTTINVEVKLCSATTNEAGLWLIVGFVDLNFTTSSVYNIIIKSGNTTLRICRVPGTNGGGGVNATFRTASQNEEIGLYAQVPSGSGTIRGNLQMLRLA